MKSDRFALFGIFGGCVFFTITGLANPFFSLYAAELGATTFAIGAMVTLKALLPIFIAMPAGQLIDSLGPVRMLQWGSWLLLSALACMVFAEGLALLALSQVLLGACIVIMASAFQVLVAKGNRDSRNEAIKRYAMWMSAGGMMGPLIGGAIASTQAVPVDGYHLAFLASTGATGVFMLVLAGVARVYPHPKADEVEIRAADVFSLKGVTGSYRSGFDLAHLRPVQFGLTATFLIMFIQALYMSFLPLYLNENGFSTMLIAVTISLKGLAAMVSRYGLTLLTKYYRVETILMGAGLVSAVCVVLTPLAVVSPVTMLILAAVLGGAVGVNLPISIMVMVDAVGEGQRGKLMGLRLLSNRFSQILSPLTFGFVGGIFGLTAAFYSAGVLLVATVAGFAVFAHRSLVPGPVAVADEPAE
ncbi:MFS transporter [Roseicyclus mahoneyensis]|jgi:MFS transporter, DHA1 family, multidrug resistance protein|uniref:Putative MFS family arabinose efflux permease n=1 Tax=Roseicyclus mahoneyensis TaxID=164332 RepID=A0A316GI56_9RHOB|nr:MFS transporter [Roseicyclus mahoneyensis]PWK60281.1 putative MFS family arabinose efflux permease [Roseicyclus mahoneyensis]